MQSAGGRGTFQRIWEAIRTRREDFTAFMIHSDSLATMGAIHHYINALVKGGYVERINTRSKCNDQQHFCLIRDCGIEYPRLDAKGQPIQRDLCTELLWRTMRMVGSEFSSRELAALASTPERVIAHTTASYYINQLVKAGYITRTKARGKSSPPRYRFVSQRYSGPRPPVVGRNTYVYDPNMDKVVWQEDITHVDL
ncbi:helix-turn-helix transcriptional regulator [Aquitalea sp. LB_tupeE]|uniref:helix-turn-helix transcriptional regulator n=1 Tax=Aquitalea sp. LB_tupeE TaxID=2748078 RepID=UPI0015C03435|nr:helix-turn-helix transcriptional regulator [Aquitalea sp. LB_tupeE]NWK80334.1 helix-turn-helix transcriptional regulator [Aquitalea sp. LB_tupeE]